MITKILAIAETETGYLEKKSNAQLDDKTANAGSANYTKYWRDLKSAWQGQPWCAAWVSWCARQAGIGEDIIPTFFDCDAGITWYKTRKLFNAAPKRGSIIFFGVPGDAQHVGIVAGVEGSRVYTIEGNTSGGSTMISNGGGVVAKSYALGYGKILGYGHPQYIIKGDDDMLTQAQFEAMYTKMITERDKLPPRLTGNAEVEYQAAKSAGITDGSRPQAPVTREEAAVMAYRAAKLK